MSAVTEHNAPALRDRMQLSALSRVRREAPPIADVGHGVLAVGKANRVAPVAAQLGRSPATLLRDYAHI